MDEILVNVQFNVEFLLIEFIYMNVNSYDMNEKL